MLLEQYLWYSEQSAQMKNLLRAYELDVLVGSSGHRV